jgi:hypothetical protein
MFARDIGELEPRRKYATLVAVIINTKASIIDEIIALNDKVLGSIFNKAKNSHNEEFQKSSKTINEKLNLYVQIGQALIRGISNMSVKRYGLNEIIRQTDLRLHPQTISIFFSVRTLIKRFTGHKR